MTDLRVDGVGEINRGGALGQFLEITVRCEDGDTVRWRIMPLRRLREEVFRHPGPARRDPRSAIRCVSYVRMIIVRMTPGS